jgi:outer membrane protein assembly factor BamB
MVLIASPACYRSDRGRGAAAANLPEQSGPIVAVAVRSPTTEAGGGEFKPHPFDWPQWQGPERTASSHETNLLKEWPKEGPPLVWKVKGLGGGYSTPSIAAGRIFGMGFKGNDEIVWCLEETTGKELWSTRIAAANRGIGYGEGPRCTPTVDGDLVYALGVSGDLACLEVASGHERWRKNLPKDFGGRMMSGWGYSESPLVDGDLLIATPGGGKATLVALKKESGGRPATIHSIPWRRSRWRRGRGRQVSLAL